jgi:DNA-binding LacI/PurR family transcriptional regulator
VNSATGRSSHWKILMTRGNPSTFSHAVKAAGAAIASRAPSERPTAVFCANDLIALGVLQEMTQSKIRVPNDVAIVGYDDIDFAAAAVPLSSVRQPRYQIGSTAAQLLLEEAVAQDTHKHRQVIFQPELEVRRSSEARPRGRLPHRPRSVAAVAEPTVIAPGREPVVSSGTDALDAAGAR